MYMEMHIYNREYGASCSDATCLNFLQKEQMFEMILAIIQIKEYNMK